MAVPAIRRIFHFAQPTHQAHDNKPIRPARRKRFKLWKLKRKPTILVLMLSVAALVGLVTLIFTLAASILAPAAAPNDAWTHLGVSISVFSFAVTVVGGLSVLIQFSEANEGQNLALYKDIYEKLMSKKAIKTRGYIYQKFPDFWQKPGLERDKAILEFLKSDDPQDQESRARMRQVLDMFDYFGFLVEQEWMTADEVIDWLSSIVAKVWLKIGPVVMYERAQLTKEQDYYLAAVNLAIKCKKWRSKYYGAESISLDRPW